MKNSDYLAGSPRNNRVNDMQSVFPVMAGRSEVADNEISASPPVLKAILEFGL